MKIDNFDTITDFIRDRFYDDDTFYFIQIIKRKKDNPDAHKSVRIIKTYYAYSLEYILDKREEIMELCEKYNARAYINLNPRSAKAVAFSMLKSVADAIYNKSYKGVSNLYDSCCGQTCSSKEKLWLIDVDNICEDSNNEFLIKRISEYVNSCMPSTGNKIKLTLKTLNGTHMMTTPFDRSKFNTEFPGIEIHKNNPTLIYFNQIRK